MGAKREPPRRSHTTQDGKRLGMSVYPPPKVAKILGRYSTKPFNQAIQCWTHVLGQASRRVEKQFSAVEWSYLVHVCEAREWEPEVIDPGTVLAVAAERAHQLNRSGESFFHQEPDARVRQVAAKLRGLDYVAAWAVIVTVQFHATLEPEPEEEEPWWTLAYRAQRAHIP